jgi:hypothetical protein
LKNYHGENNRFDALLKKIHGENACFEA